MRVGIGYDVHRLVTGRPLILGGVEIPYHLGLDGHSDADVLVHAVMDALLGAVGAGDIGKHFPDTDIRYKGISSLVLLKRVVDHINSLAWEVGNVDAVVIAQTPKLSPYIEDMVRNMARVMHVDPGIINVKATTTEKLGFEGLGEGIAAQAIALVLRHQ
ncbi:2-C-methyl-D-erythritol 2,4-cyclodiphosphate synthase [Desulfotomaculum arcticum]|uniref:2-C-methyl-D-erythritol 2,4-cyclodiphosphate synthase n=1 Tax=Desulfotruncus arcticus DSM 17038 TaxID=1121424 RepID=A0A1I2VZZ6_9FIRM|nr:2-C-methyl-D-erythritol 2,4-cyclodiphosphate synthase [Desulfotruncus arcticus]SFG94582.1 2-C-methyl-D-erythritol 2,4-cyclodiphosphate synthase [Desulfotomaculum arcticum] [Desulfotruncus arcticus DSM 17038]